MKIIIAGAGEGGFHLAKLLSYESLDITLIDLERDRLNYAEGHLDIKTLKRRSLAVPTKRYTVPTRSLAVPTKKRNKHTNHNPAKPANLTNTKTHNPFVLQSWPGGMRASD